MESLFVGIYRYFLTRKYLFWGVFIFVLAVITVGALRVRLEEDITRIFPDDERARDVSFIFQNSKFVDRLVVMVSMKDSTLSADPDELAAAADELVQQVQSDLGSHINQIIARIDDARVMEVFSLVQQYLPVFLTEQDFLHLDSLVRPDAIDSVLLQQYKQLVSPAGLITKRIIMNDLLGFSNLALRKLEHLQYDENYVLYGSYVMTKDKRHLLLFIQPAFEPNDTKNNVILMDGLDEAITSVSEAHPNVHVSYFGSSAVAVGNARQLRADTILTVSLTVVLLALFILAYFRKKRVLLLIFIPVVFGGIFSLCCIYLLQGTVSILAVAAGSVVLGIAINYSLHYLVHLKHTGNNETVIRDLTHPLTLGSTTTVLAFLFLQFANASVLRDVGLFAAFSLIGAALFSLIFLPHLVQSELFSGIPAPRWTERIRISIPFKPAYAVGVIFLLTPIFFYFAQDVGFNSDMSKLNFMKPDVRESGERLETLSKTARGAVYVVSTGQDLEQALRRSETANLKLNDLKDKGLVDRFTSVSDFLLSDSLQEIRIARWNEYWTREKKERVTAAVREAGEKLKFSEMLFRNFDSLLYKRYQPASPQVLSPFRKAFFEDYIIEKGRNVSVMALANVSSDDRPALYNEFQGSASRAFDRQLITNLFVQYVNADFTFIVTVTSILVFVALLVAYGRIELTLIAFVPMLITWIWILGLMALAGIEFNIVNVMVSTFIFGLGDDYSIFIMDGLQQDYRTRKKNLPSIRTSILLSALTTICGLGVLIFAEHPALRSVAAIAIIGIACVFVMAQTVEPFLFRWLITRRTDKGLAPMTFWGICMTFWTYSVFIVGSMVLTVIGLFLKLIPFGRRRVRLFYHQLISLFTGFLISVAITVRRKIVGRTTETFSGANVVIANHSSFLDILFMASLHPKLILLTNKWVWNSPVFGGVVRLADYYPVMEGAEASTYQLRDRVEEGYSVVVFPEGTRSSNGKIGRFHKGAFYMAQQLNLPILPVLIHGSNHGIPKNDIYLNKTTITVSVLPSIAPGDNRYGTTYQEQAKSIAQYFRAEHHKLKVQQETPSYFRDRLITNFIYKGPVLEWYLRVKLRLEKDYEMFNRLIPRKAHILDLGCGYGFLCYMLQFLSEDRVITGVDYDEEKIEIAKWGYSRTERLTFECHDITTWPFARYDIILMNDVLHYLTPDQQLVMLNRSFAALNPGGCVIIREGNKELMKKHWGTRLTEFFSVNLLRFNKSRNELHFLAGDTIRREAAHHNLTVTELDTSKFTSNVIFVIGEEDYKGA